MQLHTNNPVNKFKSQTFVRTAGAYTYRLERVEYQDFLTPIDDNRWVATTFVWLSIGHRLADANRCQLTNKASIVIDWSIDFPIIGFIDCSRPRYWYNLDTKYMNNLDSIAAAFVDVLSVLCHTVITPSTIASDSV